MASPNYCIGKKRGSGREILNRMREYSRYMSFSSQCPRTFDRHEKSLVSLEYKKSDLDCREKSAYFRHIFERAGMKNNGKITYNRH